MSKVAGSSAGHSRAGKCRNAGGTVVRLLTVVSWLSLAGAQAALAQPSGSTAPQRVIAREYFGLHILAPTRLRQWPTVGFGSWRLWDTQGTTWADVNPAPDRWTFESLDDAVKRGEEGRVELVMTLGQTPTWASSRPEEASPRGPGSAAAPADTDSWRNFVEVVARRYKGRIAAYEVWNEPRIRGVDRWNSSQFFYGSGAELAALSKTAYATVKAVDPEAVMLSPAFDGEELGLRRLAAFLEAGGGCCFDALSFHLYPHSNPIEPELMLRRIAGIRALLGKHGIDRPIWNTEFGYLHQESATVVKPQQPAGFLSVVLPPETARSYLARSFILGAYAGLERLYWYAWDTHAMSLLTASPERRPTSAAVAYREVARWLIGGSVTACGNDGTLWTCRYSGPVACDGRIYWSTGPATTVKVPAGLTRLSRLDGSEVALSSAEPVRVDGEPVLAHEGAAPQGRCAAR